MNTAKDWIVITDFCLLFYYITTNATVLEETRNYHRTSCCVVYVVSGFVIKIPKKICHYWKYISENEIPVFILVTALLKNQEHQYESFA